MRREDILVKIDELRMKHGEVYWGHLPSSLKEELVTYVKELVEEHEARADLSGLQQAKLRGELRQMHQVLVEVSRGMVVSDIRNEEEFVRVKLPLEKAKKLIEFTKPLVLQTGLEEMGVRPAVGFEMFQRTASESYINRVRGEVETEIRRQGFRARDVRVFYRDGSLQVNAIAEEGINQGKGLVKRAFDAVLLNEVFKGAVKLNVQVMPCPVDSFEEHSLRGDPTERTFAREFLGLWPDKES